MLDAAKVWLRAALCGVTLVCCAASAHAQFRASLQGTVTDQNGAVVPGATVSLVSKETNRTQQTTTSADGFYRFSQLAPGTYTITVEQQGFNKGVLDNVVVNAEDTRGVDITLTTGIVSEAVTVTDTLPNLETENGNLSRPITTAEVRGLPQFGRDPYELARLTPGVFGQGARSGSGGAVNLPNQVGPGGSNTSIFQVENQVPITANGQRVSGNNFQIDGTSVNSLQWGGAAVVTPNQESVKEVRVIANNYSAEYGRNSGAQVLTTSQNGTNEFHGSAFFKYNDPALNAFNRYNGPNNAPRVRVENRFRQFGGSLGGPLYLPRFGEGGKSYLSGKNRLFFFTSYEALRNNSNTFGTGFVETPQFRQLVQQVRPNGLAARVFNTAGVEPRVTSVIPITCRQLFGSGTQPCREIGGALDIGSPAGATGQFTGTSGAGLDNIPDLQFVQFAIPNQQRGKQLNARVDYTRGNDTVAVSTYITRRNDLQSDPTSFSRPLGDLTFKPLNTYGSILYNRVLSSTTINEARFNVTRFAYNQVTSSTITNFGIPRIEVEGYPTDRVRFGAPQGGTTPGIFAQNTFEFRDTLRTVRGNHALSFGGEARREQDNSNLAGNARPAYSFVGLFNLANDAPVFQFIAVDPRTGGVAQTQRYFRTNTLAGFVQDDWKLRPNLTVNLGLRYEYFSPLTEKEGRLTNLDISGGLANARLVKVDRFYAPDRNNFAPRVAFAYSPNIGGFGGLLRENRAVLRGGFGVAYNRIPNVVFSNARNNPPNVANLFLCCAFSPQDLQNLGIRFALGPDRSPFGYPGNARLAQGIDPRTGFPVSGGAEVYAAFDVPTPYVYSYSLELQNQLPWKLTSSLAYQGSTSHKLVRTVPQQFLFEYETGSFIRGLGPIFVARPDVNANYNALVARLSRRLSNGLSFDGNYRFSKSIDTVSGEFGAATNQTYPVDQRFERGPSDFDVRHTLTASALYELPFFRNRRGAAGALLGGFEINPIVTYNTGFPWTPKSGRGVATPFGFFGPLRPVAYTGGALRDTSNEAFIRAGGNFPGGGLRYFTPPPNGATSFTQVRPGIGRNVFRGPRYFSTDLSLVKRTALPFLGLGERSNLDLRANFFNLFNQINLAPIPETFIDSPNFGRATGGLAGRVVELQARFNF